jgi:hypothetical protein
MAVEVARLERELTELIAALDRRVPQLDRAGEPSIARDAAALRARAQQRLAELDHRGRGETPVRVPPSGGG